MADRFSQITQIPKKRKKKFTRKARRSRRKTRERDKVDGKRRKIWVDRWWGESFVIGYFPDKSNLRKWGKWL